MEIIMKKITNTAEILKSLKTNELVLAAKIPMGYSSGYPILQNRNGSLCMTVPYLRYKITGETDKTQVYPIRYTVTVEIPENKVVRFENLAYAKGHTKVNFDKHVGYFRHDAIKDLTKKQYEEKRSELYGYYDRLIAAVLGEGEFTADDEKNMKELLGMLLEPCLKGAYKVLDKDFYNKFLV